MTNVHVSIHRAAGDLPAVRRHRYKDRSIPGDGCLVLKIGNAQLELHRMAAGDIAALADAIRATLTPEEVLEQYMPAAKDVQPEPAFENSL